MSLSIWYHMRDREIRNFAVRILVHCRAARKERLVAAPCIKNNDAQSICIVRAFTVRERSKLLQSYAIRQCSNTMISLERQEIK